MMTQRIEFQNYAPTLGRLVERGFEPFNDWWSTYIPEHKDELCRKILHKYWFNQIGSETPERFKHYLNQQLEEIMPYYNQLYASELLKFNPLLNHALNTNERSVENLVKLANTDTTEVGEALRDFAKNGNTKGKQVGNLTGVYDKTIDRDVNTQYTKDGTEDNIIDTTDNTARTIVEAETKDHTSTDDKTVDTTNNETVHTEGTGKTDTTTKGHRTASGFKGYSDTPQKDLSKDAIRSDYLTNATWTTDTEDTTGETHTTNEYSEDKTTDFTGKEVTDDDQTHKEKNDKNTTDTKVETIHTVEDNEWHEEGDEKRQDDTVQNAKTVEDTTEHTETNSFEGQKERNTNNTLKGVVEDTKKSTDTGSTSIAEGYMNVSASSLLNAFRETFLNIDHQIIEDLRENFMEVYN